MAKSKSKAKEFIPAAVEKLMSPAAQKKASLAEAKAVKKRSKGK